ALLVGVVGVRGQAEERLHRLAQAAVRHVRVEPFAHGHVGEALRIEAADAEEKLRRLEARADREKARGEELEEAAGEAVAVAAEHGDAAAVGNAAAYRDAELAADLPSGAAAVEGVRPEVEAVAAAKVGDGAAAEMRAPLENGNSAAAASQINGGREA